MDDKAFGFGKAAAASHFNLPEAQREDYYFSRCSSIVETALLNIDLALSTIQLLLYPHVAQYINTATPKEIFREYGTHVTTSLVVGGMLELWSGSEKSNFSSKEEFT